MRDSVLTAQEALTVALKHLDSIPQGRRMSALTTRENEVLALVAEGLTDRDIAGRLYISVRTANTHVAAIIRKLGVSSRREAAERYRAEQDRSSSAPE